MTAGLVLLYHRVATLDVFVREGAHQTDAQQSNNAIASADGGVNAYGSNFFNASAPAGWDTDGAGPIVGLRSNDPGRAFTTPEPATLLLMAGGMLGLVGARRLRRRSRTGRHRRRFRT